MMQKSVTLENKNYLITSLIGIVIIVLVTNIGEPEKFYVNEDYHVIDIIYIIVPIFPIIFSAILIVKYRLSGYHGKAWVLFALAFCMYFAAEQTYDYDVEYDINDISTLTSDLFYIGFYPLFFVFSILYLMPRKNIISKKMILMATLTSMLLVVPTLYITFDTDEEIDELTYFLYGIYPILDGIIIIPPIIALYLFFRGKINLLWTLLLLASIIIAIGDTAYLIISIEDEYDLGHPVDILFLWGYVLYAFGTLSHVKLFKNQKESPSAS